MKTLLYFILIMLVLLGCKKENKKVMINSCNNIPYLKKEAIKFVKGKLNENIKFIEDGVYENNEKYIFYFKGVKEYRLPGYHWNVRIMKNDCSFFFIPGK